MKLASPDTHVRIKAGQPILSPINPTTHLSPKVPSSCIGCCPFAIIPNARHRSTNQLTARRRRIIVWCTVELLQGQRGSEKREGRGSLTTQSSCASTSIHAPHRDLYTKKYILRAAMYVVKKLRGAGKWGEGGGATSLVDHLAVGEDAGVVAVQDADHKRGNLGVHGFLSGLQSKHLDFVCTENA